MIPTLIIFVLDSSGSMQQVRDPTISGFNEFLQEQQGLPGEAFMTLTLFRSSLVTSYVGEPIDKVSELGSAANPYSPSGMTALFDGVGSSIKSTEAWIAKHAFAGQVLCVVLTDGHENSSKEWHVHHPLREDDPQDVAGLIRWKQQVDGWQFQFLGSGGTDWLEQTFGHVVQDAYTSYGAADTHGTYSRVSKSATAARSGAKFDIPPQ